jgi:hypothetical protein
LVACPATHCNVPGRVRSVDVGQEFQFQQTTLGLHIKPLAQKPFRQVVTEFVNAKALGSDAAAMFGVSVYHDDYSFVIDASGAVPGGLFVKIVRNFPPDERFEDMGKAIYADELGVLQRVGLKLQ